MCLFLLRDCRFILKPYISSSYPHAAYKVIPSGRVLTLKPESASSFLISSALLHPILRSYPLSTPDFHSLPETCLRLPRSYLSVVVAKIMYIHAFFLTSLSLPPSLCLKCGPAFMTWLALTRQDAMEQLTSERPDRNRCCALALLSSLTLGQIGCLGKTLPKSPNGEFYTLRNLASGQQQPALPGQSSECLTAEADAPTHNLHGTQHIHYYAKLLNFGIICCISLYNKVHPDVLGRTADVPKVPLYHGGRVASMDSTPSHLG